jgi:hypothetical protein
MNPELHYNPESKNEDEGNLVEDALTDAGLHQVRAPKPGSPVYQRLIEAARGYMNEIKSGEKISPPASLPSTYNDSDDYYRSNLKKSSPRPPSDVKRREYHDKLSIMLLGKPRNELSRSEANQVSNFAAFVTGDEEGYVDTWGK